MLSIISVWAPTVHPYCDNLLRHFGPKYKIQVNKGPFGELFHICGEFHFVLLNYFQGRG